MSTALHQIESSELPAGQQLVLLILLRDSLAKKVLPLLQQDSGVRKPASADWELLIQKGFVRRTTHWFLTQYGRMQAARTAKAIARRHGIHHVTESGNISGFPLHASCTCGWSSDAQRTWNGQARLNNAISRHLTMVEADDVRHSARDIRQEPDAPLEGISVTMQAALLDLAQGKLTRLDSGYAHTDYNKKVPLGPIHPVVTLNALQERKLVRLFATVGTDGKEGEAHLTGDGAWVVRTLRRQMP